MSRRFLLLPLVAVMVAITGCATRQAEPSGDDEFVSEAIAKYENLRDRVRDGDTSVSMQTLREAYVQTPHYQPYAGPVEAALRSIARHANAGEFDACLRGVREVEDIAFPMLTVHHYGGYCASELGQQEEFETYMGFARAIHQAIIEPGDGKSQRTAWRTLATPELYLVLAIHGLQPKSQALVNGENRMFDLMTVIAEGEETEQARYFDITPQMTAGMEWLRGDEQ